MLRKIYATIFKQKITDPIVFADATLAAQHLYSLLQSIHKKLESINQNIVRLILMHKITKEKLSQAKFRTELAKKHPTLMKLILERKQLQNELYQINDNWVIATKNKDNVQSFCIMYLEFNNNKIKLRERLIPIYKNHTSLYVYLGPILANHDNPISIERLLRPSLSTCSYEHRYSFLDLKKYTEILAVTFTASTRSQCSAEQKKDKTLTEARRIMEADLEMLENILNPDAPPEPYGKESKRDTQIVPAPLSKNKFTLYAASQSKISTYEEVVPAKQVVFK